MDDILKVDGLTYDYPGRRALAGVGFSLPRGSITALVGPNGAGKTTLLRCLAALDEPLAGHVVLDGIDVFRHPRQAHKHLGYLEDSFGLYAAMTLRQCLIYRAWAQGLAKEKVAEAVDKAAQRVALSDRLADRVGTFSRGMKQRVAIAQAIIHQPPLLLLDEPASGLDPEARLSLADLMRQLRAEGLTILVSSHILAELQDYSTHLLILEDGRLISFEALGATARRERVTVRIELAEAFPALAELLKEAEGAADITLDGLIARVSLPDKAEDLARLLRTLIQAGVPLSAFAPERANLQDAYLERVKAARQ